MLLVLLQAALNCREQREREREHGQALRTAIGLLIWTVRRGHGGAVGLPLVLSLLLRIW